jgi:hypothetical protein
MAGKWSWTQAFLRELWYLLASSVFALYLIVWLLPYLCWPRKSGYRKVHGQWAWVGYNLAVGRWEAILGADTKSFVVLDSAGYGKDCERVFFEWRAIPDADPASFEILPYEVGRSARLYSKDRSHVYLEGYQVTGADPESFAVIDAPYARDRLRVYCGTVPMDGADPETFEVMRIGPGWGLTPDKEHFVRFNPEFADLEVSKSRPAITSDGSWAKDARHHYRGAARVVGADYETFHATDGILGGADKDHQYLGALREDEFDRVVKRQADHNRRGPEADQPGGQTSQT